MSHSEEQSSRKSLAQLFVIAIIVLIPILLSELFLERSAAPLKPTSPSAVTSAPPKLNTFSVGFKGDLDRDAFLASFRRQARVELLPCLEKWEFQDRSLVFIGKLTKTGELSVRSTIPAGVIPPDCVAQSIGKMNFAPLTTSMKEKFLEVDWRLDW